MDIEDATDELIQVIGRAVYDKAENAYLKGEGNDQVRLVQLVQRPIALLATLHYFQRNDVSHEDSGRKVKLSSDGTDKIPWEWQLDRDDSIHLQAYYSAVERLIRWLNESKDADWQKSDAYRHAAGLLIRSGREFDSYFLFHSPNGCIFFCFPSFVRYRLPPWRLPMVKGLKRFGISPI